MTGIGNGDDSQGHPSIWLLAGAFATLYVVWGSTYLAIKIAIETLPPFTMTATRFLVAGVPLFLYARTRDRTRIAGNQWRSAAFSGVLMLCGGTGLVAWSEQHVASAPAALLVATVPLWLVVLNWLVFRGIRPTLVIVLGLCGGLLGVFVLIGPGELLGERLDVTGASVILCGCVFWAFGSLFAKHSSLPRSPWTTASIQMICAGVVLLTLGALTGEWSRISPAAISMRSVLALSYLVLAGSLLAFTAYSWLLKVATPAQVGTYAYVNPVVAMILGVTIGGEVLPARAWLGAAVIIFSVLLISTSRKQVRPESRIERPVDSARPPAPCMAGAPIDGRKCYPRGSSSG